MVATSDRYPALVDRALQLLSRSADGASDDELCRHVFGASGVVWTRLLARIAGADARIAHDAGRWRLVAAAERRIAVAETRATYSAEPVASDIVGIAVVAVGPKPWRAPIVGLAASRGNHARNVQMFFTLARPERPIHLPRHLNAIGIREEDLESAPSLAEALDDFLAFIGGAPLAALDIGVAAARLQFACRAHGIASLTNRLVELAIPDERRPDLARHAIKAGIRLPTRLTPIAIADAHRQIALASDSAQPTDHALGATSPKALLDPAVMDAMARDPGVYVFRDRAGRALYVGKATSLRSRLASYISADFAVIRQMPGLIELTARIDTESFPCEPLARAREAWLIAKERPPYNTQRVIADPIVWVSLDATRGPSGMPGRLRLTMRDRQLPASRFARVSVARIALRHARTLWYPTRLAKRDLPTEATFDERLGRVETTFALALERASRSVAWLERGAIVVQPFARSAVINNRRIHPGDGEGDTDDARDQRLSNGDRGIVNELSPGRPTVVLILAAGEARFAALNASERIDPITIRDALQSAGATVYLGAPGYAALARAVERGDATFVPWPE
ncbi:MAG: hypothetical protein EPO26_01295 [Chloroflexota bacterium]|nr:MAG: hypothetical protein EPO26_01295 [Chloroflexota bacterium]